MTPAMCEVCHCRAATRVVTLGGVGVCVCAICRSGRPADVVDAWRVRNVGQRNPALMVLFAQKQGQEA
jgi:hypothetical protein